MGRCAILLTAPVIIDLLIAAVVLIAGELRRRRLDAADDSRRIAS
jgi:hypothetical protein